MRRTIEATILQLALLVAQDGLDVRDELGEQGEQL